MSLNARIILTGFLLLGLVVAWSYLDATPESIDPGPKDVGVPPTDLHGALELKSSKDCRACHEAVYDEWLGSHHQLAWVNPEPRRKELSDNFKNKDCIPCHAPRPLIEVGYGKRPLERESRRDDGVNCMTCHRYKNVMAGANELSSAGASAPCNPVTWEPIREMTMCAPCHDQHKVNKDWLNTRFADESSPEHADCNDCHMPVTPGPGTQGGSRSTHRGHGFAGGHDKDILKTSASLKARVIDADADLAKELQTLTGRSLSATRETGLKGHRLVIVEVKNSGVGHNFPSDERHRAVDLEARFMPDGRAPGAEVRLTRFRNPYRHEFEILNPFQDKAGVAISKSMEWDGAQRKLWQLKVLPEFNPDREIYYPKSTQLAAGESRILWFAADREHKGALQLKLYYKLNPYLGNDEAVVCNELTINL